MKNFLPKLVAFITRKPRYKPEVFVWPEKSITGKFYSIVDKVFWVRHGIKLQSKTDILTGRHLSYTFRDFCTHSEVVIRKHFPKFSFKVIPVPVLVTDNGLKLPLGLFPKINFAIAFVSATATNADSNTVDAGSASNRIMIEASCGPTSDSWTSTTWNGESFTKYLNALYSAVGRYNYIWALYPSGTGSHTLTNTGPGGDYSATTTLIYSGVKQTGSPKNVGQSTGTGTSGSKSITANNGDWLVGGGGNDANVIVASTNTTLRSGASSQGQADSNGAASPTALNFTFTGSSANWAAYGGAIEPAPASVVNGNFLNFM